MTTSNRARRPDFQALENESPYPVTAWACDFALEHLEKTLAQWRTDYGLDLDPDFQRAHVWTDAQREAFLEYLLGGGPHAREIYFACKGWSSSLSVKPAMVIVDGKQRLESVLRFLRNELPVRGAFRKDWTGVLRFSRGGSFRFSVADLDREQTLRWYLALNRGGTPHTDLEIERVRALLAQVTK